MIPDIEGFGNYLRYELNRSPHTVRAYLRDLTQFQEFHSNTHAGASVGNDDLPTSSDIRRWLGQIASEGIGPRSLRRKIQSLRAYFRYLERKRHMDSNPAADLQLAKLPKKLPEFIPENDMKSLLSGRTSDRDGLDMRNRLVLELLYATGIRQAELLGIKDSDISQAPGEIRIHGKRDKDRVIPITGELGEKISAWQRVRDMMWPREGDRERHLVEGPSGVLSKSALYKTVKEAMAACGLNGSPHTLRHTFATAMLNGGAGINTVKEFLGHASLSATQIYTHVNFRQMQKAYLDSHPRGGRASEPKN